MSLALLTRGYVYPSKRATQTVVVSPVNGSQEPLQKSLNPIEFTGTEALGIFQSDVIIRTAIVAGLADLRKNPYLLDYVFASLPHDELTRKDYGEKSVSQAKKWFLNNKIEVAMVPVMNQAKAPLVTIKLLDSTEAESTLGDVHYAPDEYDYDPGPAITKEFNPSYDPLTGTFRISSQQLGGVFVVPGMTIADSSGTDHEILKVTENGFAIVPGTVGDFRRAVLRGRTPSIATSLESVSYKETYQIGVHVSGEPVYLTWLHSVVVFCLLRYKEALLESRGFGRSVVGSSGFDKNPEFTEEHIFSRYLTISGYVRQYWPKVVGATTIQAVEPGDVDSKTIGAGFIVNKGGKMEPTIDPNDSLYMGDEDIVKIPNKR